MFEHPMLERHRHQQEVWKKSRSVWLEACRHQLVDNLPPKDLLHHTIDTGFETQRAVSEGHLTFGGALALSCASASLATCATFSPLLPLILPVWDRVFAVYYLPCQHEVCHHRFAAQPTSLNGHRKQKSQSRARSHVLAALDSTCREPPCISQHSPSYERVKSVRVLKITMDAVRLYLPSRFRGQLPLPSHLALRAGYCCQVDDESSQSLHS